ncbi:MAG TPA: hypothetical protein VKF59_04475 [Candidatus Dormibacteraeota bacterium]|nr:hypothetical protein [Candidatus Dormibacteraeota bacterium]
MVDQCRRAIAALTMAGTLAASCSGLPGQSRVTPQTPVRPLSHAAYQAQLTAASNLIGGALDRVAGAGSPDVLATALADAGATSPRAANVLSEGLPPADVYDSTGRFVLHLRLLGDELQSLVDQAQSFKLCGGPSAMAALSALDHAQKLRAASQEVAAHGYQVRDLIPPETPLPDRHAANSSLLLDMPDRGDGPELAVDNGTGEDGMVTVLRDGSPRLALYVTAHATASVPGIPNGSYAIFFTQGQDWDAGLKAFTRSCSFESFDKPLQFDGTTNWTVGLKPTANGFPTHRVAPKDYPKV